MPPFNTTRPPSTPNNSRCQFQIPSPDSKHNNGFLDDGPTIPIPKFQFQFLVSYRQRQIIPSPGSNYFLSSSEDGWAIPISSHSLSSEKTSPQPTKRKFIKRSLPRKMSKSQEGSQTADGESFQSQALEEINRRPMKRQIDVPCKF